MKRQRKRSGISAGLAILLWAGFVAVAVAESIAPSKLYEQHCVACHGADRLGGIGPALLPSSLERLKKPAAEKTISEGRVATQMPAFNEKLSANEIRAVADYLYKQLDKDPAWELPDMRASRVEHVAMKSLSDKPVFKADPLNLFVVVESGDHHVTILDGDRFEPITRFQSRFALHGGPKFSPDGRFVYFASRDGWISKYDLWNLTMVVEVRAGINARNAAVSGDGKWVMVANYLPHSLVVLDADLNPVKVLPAVDLQGKTSSRVSAVYDASPRKSFIAAMKDIKELWEISYDPKAEPVYAGLVHDYRTGEGIAEKGQFAARRTPLDDYLDDFFFDQSYSHAIGASRGKDGVGGGTQVVNMHVRRKIADLALPGMPHLASGITWQWQGRTVLATPNLNQGMVSIIDMNTWKTIKQIKTLGPGFFMRSHEASRYAWVDSMMSAGRDTLQVIDKETLEIAGQVRPEPGKSLAHVEFTRDGRYVLASLWEKDGAIIVFDAQTLKEVKRIPMNIPLGKYNVYNKITRSEGTSH